MSCEMRVGCAVRVVLLLTRLLSELLVSNTRVIRYNEVVTSKVVTYHGGACPLLVLPP